MLAGEEIAHLGHRAVEEEVRLADAMHRGKRILRLERQRTEDEGELGVEELEVVDVLDVAGVDEDRRERAGDAVLVVARRRRAHRTENVGGLLLADLRRVAEAHLILRGIAVAVGRTEMEVVAAVARLVPPRQPGAAHRERLAAVERVVAGVVAVGAEGADRPGRRLVLGIAVGHDPHVAGRGERVDE